MSCGGLGVIAGRGGGGGFGIFVAGGGRLLRGGGEMCVQSAD